MKEAEWVETTMSLVYEWMGSVYYLGMGGGNLLSLDFMIGVIYIMAQVSQLRLYNLLFTYPSMLIS